MPSWLRVMTANQPITQAIDTVRSVLAGQPAGNHLWLALAELAVVVGVASSLATALFRRRATSA